MNSDFFRAQFVGLKHTTRICVSEDVFKFNRRKKWIMIQNLCFWILKKIGCFHVYDVADIDTVTINKQKLVEVIMMQKILCLDWYREEPTRMLIGSQTLNELMMQPEMYHMFKFDINDRIHMQREDDRGQFHRRVFGLEITVIPTMSGIIVLP